MRWTSAVALALGLAAVGGACAPSGPEGAGLPSIPPPTSTPTSLPAPTPAGFSDADDGRTVTLTIGQRATVILHSADFVFRSPSDPAVARPDGPPTVTASPATCVEAPGSGCGTVVASFVGVAPGTAELGADRASCTEPACAPADAGWRLEVRVVDPSTTTTLPPAEVRGTVRFSPVCPVERIPPDPACAPRPGPATVELARPDGIVVAQDRTGDDGAFILAAAPGTYDVRAFSGAAGAGAAIGRGCQADPARVELQPGTSTTVAVSCDTGIR